MVFVNLKTIVYNTPHVSFSKKSILEADIMFFKTTSTFYIMITKITSITFSTIPINISFCLFTIKVATL